LPKNWIKAKATPIVRTIRGQDLDGRPALGRFVNWLQFHCTSGIPTLFAKIKMLSLFQRKLIILFGA
jgi:hypothetical protein